MSPACSHTQRVRGLAHAWLLIRDVCLGWQWAGHAAEARFFLNPLTTDCPPYHRAVERYGAGPR